LFLSISNIIHLPFFKSFSTKTNIMMKKGQIIFTIAFLALVNTVAIFAQNKPFPQQLTYPGCIKPNHVNQASLNSSVTAYYDYWKGKHLKNNLSSLPGGYYVKGEITGSADGYTPLGSSEGQGYGMVITVLMAGYDANAKTIYDGLFKTARAFKSSENSNLMGWVVADAAGAQGHFDSATDGDMDIAYSLVLAHYQWGSGGAINYLEEAKKMITNGLKASNVTSNNRLNLGDWDAKGSYDTRPSDWMLSHMRAFYTVTNDVTWLNVINNLYSVYNGFTASYSATTGLVTDFIVGNPAKPCPANFLDEYPETNTYSYNACRVPLRLVMDYALYGTENSKTASDKIANWIKGKASNAPGNIKDGYQLNGTATGSYATAVFVSPFIAAGVTNSANQAWVNSGWDWMKNAKEGYYSDSYNMLSMIFISGNWWIPGGSAPVNQLPTVSIISPANNASFTAPASITINANAADADGTISKVDFYNGATLLFSDNSSPYSYSWTGVAAGTYNITAKATDNANATATSAVVTVTVTAATNQAPTVSITSPANGTSFTAPASITINANAADADGTISKVDFYNGATLLFSDNSSPYSYSWTGVAAGTYSITAKATDNANATATSDVVTVTVTAATNQAPTVSITSPANGATFTAPASITINANAADADGTVSKVDFYNGATLLFSDNSSPYSYSWTGIAAGTYNITAKATDNSNASTTSSVVTVTVNPVVVTQSPYGGTPQTIPGVIEAEKYDLGGQGIAYNETTTANQGGAFRTTEAVDVEPYGTGFNVGYIVTNEWLEYTVNVTAGTYKIDANVAATAAGKNFRLELDGTTIATFSVPNTGGWATFQLSTVNNVVLTEGQKVLRLFATTTDFNVDKITFTAVTSNPNVAPTVSITSPANGASFNAPANITINANAADADGTVSKVDFYNGAALLFSDNSSPYSYNWTGVAAGTYNITAKATDNSGAETTSSAVSVIVTTITVPNQAPTVNLTSPSNGSSANAPATISIAANAADTDGTVNKVDFYNGGTLLFSDNSSPYSYNWSNVSAGTYSITAKATDNSGATTTSSAVSITVNTVVTNVCSSIAQYVENNGYVAGSKVKNANNQYQCKPYPYTGWCNGAAWAYAPGTGAYWSDAWTLVGSCGTARTADDATVNEKSVFNSPNPFSQSTTIEVMVVEAGEASVKVYDQTGQLVQTLSEGYLIAGTHQFAFDASSLKAGLYIVKYSTNSGVTSRKIMKTE
jgi:endo-1,4-beta-D-glucanase Y/predicted RNA-binding Zn ribbon-like protein